MIASIPSPSSNGIGVGPFEIHAYGLMYALAVAAAVLDRDGGAGGTSAATPTSVYEVAIWGFPAGLIGGRLYFDITSFNEMPHTWYGPIAVWDGGLGIWGGIAAGAAVGIWRVHRAGVSIPDFMDATAPALLVAQAIGRIGNYFNQELFGGPTNLPWAPPDLTRTPPRAATSTTPPSSRPSSTRSSGTSPWPPSWSGSATTARSSRPASSPSTSPATRPSASSRRASASTPPTTSSASASTSGSRSSSPWSASPGSSGPSAADGRDPIEPVDRITSRSRQNRHIFVESL